MHKQALLHAIDLHGDRVAAELAELRAHPPPLQVPVDVLERSGAEHLEALRAFRSSVQALAPADIPEALRSLYLSCRRGTCRGGIEVAEALDFIAAVGMPAVNVLLPEFGALEPHQQEDVLMLIQRLRPDACPDVAEQALKSPTVRVRSVALSSLGACGGGTFLARVRDFLHVETDPGLQVQAIELLREKRQPYWREALVAAAQQGRLGLDRVEPLLCSAGATNEGPFAEDSQLDLSFWLKEYARPEGRKECLLSGIFLRLEAPAHLAKLQPVFRSAVAFRYAVGGRSSLHGRVSGPSSPWSRLPRAAVDTFLGTLRRNLGPSTLRHWLQQPDTLLPEQILLRSWLGEDAAAVAPRKLQLKIELLTKQGARVDGSSQEVELGRNFSFEVSSAGSPRNVFKGRGRARFDTAEMVYVLEDVLIELRPHGALWTASLPVGGTLDVTLNDASGPWVWRFTDETPHPSMR